MKRLLLLFATTLIFACPATSICSPMTAPAASPSVRSSQTSEWRRLYQTSLRRLVRWQKVLRAKLTRVLRDLRKDPWGRSLWTFLALAFLYGIVHAVGPGHGKAIVGSYFLNRSGTWQQGIHLGFLFAFTHVFSAVLLLLVGHVLLKATAGRLLDSASQWLQKVSGLLLIGIGTLLTGRILCSCLKNQQNSPPQNFKADLKSLGSVAAAAGLIPCPGAALILLFALSQQLLVPGLLSMLALALGMALTVSLSALATIVTRGALQRVLPASPGVAVAGRLLGATGGLAIAALGVLLLSSQT
jgi:nickel/cobalt exporter